MVEHFLNLGSVLEFRLEKPQEYFGSGDRVVVSGVESVEIKKSGVTVPHSEFATVLDFQDGLITRFLVIQDLSAVLDAYRSS